MMKSGALNTLELMSKDQGRHMDSPESVKVRVACCGLLAPAPGTRTVV